MWPRGTLGGTQAGRQGRILTKKGSKGPGGILRPGSTDLEVRQGQICILNCQGDPDGTEAREYRLGEASGANMQFTLPRRPWEGGCCREGVKTWEFIKEKKKVRKQENTHSSTQTRTRPRKKELVQENTHSYTQTRTLERVCFCVDECVFSCFFTFVFSFINSQPRWTVRLLGGRSVCWLVGR